MIAINARAALLGFVVISAASLPAFAQESVEAPLSLSGTYTLTSVYPDTNTTSVDFSATITNAGAEDVTGVVVLRHPNVIQQIYYRFGEQTIPAGGNVTVSGAVTVPTPQFKDWATAGPGVFLNRQNARGDIETYRISCSKVQAPPSQ
jgi:hypothetical protein